MFHVLDTRAGEQEERMRRQRQEYKVGRKKKKRIFSCTVDGALGTSVSFFVVIRSWLFGIWMANG